MHTAPMADSDGEFAEWVPIHGNEGQWRHRPECKNADVRFRTWESNCGGYEDYQYRCFGCGATWWVEGPDA